MWVLSFPIRYLSPFSPSSLLPISPPSSLFIPTYLSAATANRGLRERINSLSESGRISDVKRHLVHLWLKEMLLMKAVSVYVHEIIK